MPIIECAISEPAPGLGRVVIEVDRHQLQKCRFRCTARDGTDFAFSLEEPLENGACVYENATHCYEVRQLVEKVLRVELPQTASASALLAWQIGNLHQPVDIRDRYLLVADDPALRRLLKKHGYKHKVSKEIFSPPAHSAFSPHTHVPGLEYDHSHLFGTGHPTGI